MNAPRYVTPVLYMSSGMSVRNSIIQILSQNNGVIFGFLFKKIEPRNTSYMEIAEAFTKLKEDGILFVENGRCYLTSELTRTAS